MLRAVTQFLASLAPGGSAAPPEHDEVQLAAAALIVQLARIDGAFSAREAAWLREAVATYTGLTGEEADRFIALAEEQARESGDYAASVEMLRRKLEPAQRLTLVALMWKLAMADGTLHEFEDDLIARTAELLGLGPEEATAIREAELGR